MKRKPHQPAIVVPLRHRREIEEQSFVRGRRVVLEEMDRPLPACDIKPICPRLSHHGHRIIEGQIRVRDDDLPALRGIIHRAWQGVIEKGPNGGALVQAVWLRVRQTSYSTETNGYGEPSPNTNFELHLKLLEGQRGKHEQIS